MSVNEAIERLEGVHEMRGGLTPLFRESAALLREAKEIIQYIEDANLVVTAAIAQRAARWLEE